MMKPLFKLDELTWREDPILLDVESIKGLVESSTFFSPEELQIAVELIQERLSKGMYSGYHFLFSERAGAVIGYACYGPIPGTRDSHDLYWIAVKNDQRGFGLGKVILKRVEQKIGALGGRKIYVETSSRDQYKPTQAFYSKCGYKKEAVFRDFYSAGDDKIIYVKTLSHQDGDGFGGSI
ncbi:MAG: GNAT family N-acetyltransferase [Deltaproteobacteria bacterium]|nr:GNAT family N-acetyltransferase [Deltaproteobacteria bacterium]